ncbi:hypothetical protein QRW90_16480 [Clostridioides difficile]|nr:hypothetical protein [Clostridioides difficile]MDL5120578.1 hypothetical protein [Clostridioides difficile]QFS33377.1 hypothetical protein FTB24_19250 [Clostridioides difficile]QIF80146.1 hypothetical protein EUU24_16870 [Clostridioides difficile]
MVESTLTEYSDFFSIAGVIEDMIRWILFELVKLLTYIADGVEGIVDKLYTLNHFFENKQVQALYNNFKPIFWIILTLSILYVGYKIVIDREFKGERIFQNFILSSMVILALPAFMTSLEKITTESINVLNTTKVEENATTARMLIKDNLYDLEYLESKDFKLDGYGNNNKVSTNNINSKNILKIQINSTMSSGGFLNPTNEVYSKKLVLDENGKDKVVNMEKSFFNLIQEQYYRFNLNFFNMIISLLCLVLTFTLTSIKIARIIVELAFKKIFAMTLAFGDIASGQKLKAILKDILSSFAIIFTTALLLKLYTIGTTWVGTIDANEVVQLVFIIALSIMVIDAPNIIERILGIDAGIKSGWALIAGAYSSAKTMGEIGKFGGNMLSSSTNTLASAGAGAKGIYDGFNGSTLEDERNSNSNSSENKNSKENNYNSSDNNSSNNLSSNDMKDKLSDERENLNTDNISQEDNINGFDDSISGNYGEYKSLSDDISDNNSLNGVNEDLYMDDNISDNSQRDTLESDINSDGVLNSNNNSDIENSTLESDMNSDKELNSNNNSDIENGTLESDINSDRELNSNNGSNIENNTLENDISSNSRNSLNEDGTIGEKGTLASESSPNRNETLENGLNNESKDKKDSPNLRSENIGNNENTNKNSMSDKDILNNSNKLDTRTLGQYSKDKIVDSINSSKQVQNSKKYYQIGLNTGNKLSSVLKDNKNKERK